MNNRTCDFPECEKKHQAKGLCVGHYTQLLKGKPLTPIGNRPILDRFWEKVEKTDTCWNWTAAINVYGYGAFGTEGRKIVRAHRFSYELHHGPVGSEMHIDHMCHNRRCVNTDHLRPVSPKQNQENRNGPRVDSSSGVRGVYHDKARGKWSAEVRHDRKKIFVGRFDTVEEAEAAAVAKRNELFTHNDRDRAA